MTTGGPQPLRSIPLAASAAHFVWRVAPYLLIFSAFALRISSITFQSLWRDEVDALRFALMPLADLVKTFTQPGFNGPLYFLMLRGWIGLAGQSELALRFPSLIFGVMSVALLIVLGTRLFNRTIGLIAGALLTCSAYQVWYGQEAKMYTLITLLALAAIYFLRRAVVDGKVRFWIGVVVCTTLAMYAHILAALLIPVEVALFVLWWPLSRRQLLAGAIGLACLTLPYLPLALWQVPLAFQPAITGYGRYALGEMISILGAAYTRGVLNGSGETALVIVSGLSAALAVFGLMSVDTPSRPGLRRDRVLMHAGLLAWLLIPLLVIFLISINRPIFTDRYLIWIQPVFYLAVALGLFALWTWLKPLAVIGLAALIVVGLAGVETQAVTPYKSDFRSAARMIEQSARPEDLIVFQIPYVRYTFDYYFKQPYQSIDGPYTNFVGTSGYLDSEAAIFQRLADTFQNRHIVWLVASEVPLWDQRDLLRRWLNEHGAITLAADFPQVQVVRYELR